jgi:hypothetical protein
LIGIIGYVLTRGVIGEWMFLGQCFRSSWEFSDNDAILLSVLTLVQRIR